MEMTHKTKIVQEYAELFWPGDLISFYRKI